jgi:uncharacterized protein (TIGR03435 family)
MMAVSLIAKVTVITALALGAGWLARRRRAAVRHLIFVSAFAVLALLPAVSVVVPPVPVPVRIQMLPGAADTSPVVPLNRPSGTLMFVVEGPSSAGSHAWPALSTFTLLATAWFLGVVCCLVPVAVGLWQIRRVRRESLPWGDAQVMTNEMARQASLGRPVDVLVHGATAGPMTCGVVRPAIVFPPDAQGWCEADVRRALAHELEHVRRSDWLTLCLARVISAAYWFHPLVWIANRQLSVTAEHACDDAVLRDNPAFGYADQLVTLAERSLARTRHQILAMAGRGDLSTRVRAVLNTRQHRGPAGMWAGIIMTVAAAASIALLAPLRTVASAVGQTSAPTARPRFEVASIKPSPFFDRIMNVRPLPGRLTADATLQVLMQYAYGVQPFQLVGGPGWLTSDHYEIEARTDVSSNRDQLFLMLQTLLEDRFQLRTHREMKELPVFMLVSNRGGFTLPAPADGACVDSSADAAAEWVGSGRMAFPGELPPAKGRCGSVIVSVAHVAGGKIAMSEFVRALSMMLGRTVLDRTGFTAPFDLQLDFVPDETTPAMPPPPPGASASGVPLTVALEQQLGLRLEPAKGPVDVLVVDQAERPSPN